MVDAVDVGGVKDLGGGLQTLATNFRSELVNGVRNDNYVNTPGYLLFAEQQTEIQKDLDSNKTFEVPTEMLNIETYAQRLVSSVVEDSGSPDATRILIYGEQLLRETGTTPGSIVQKIREVVDQSFLPDVSKESLLTYINGLRNFYFRQNGEKRVPVKMGKDLQVEIKPESGEMNYASFRIEGLNYSQTADAGIETVETSDVALIVSASEEYRDEGKFNDGEDAAAIIENPNQALLVVADGVSGSFLGGLASKRICQHVSQEGGFDLRSNLDGAAEACKQMHDSMEVPGDVIDVIKDVLTKRKEKGGSQSTMLQLKIDKNTGRVEGLIVGDGVLMVLRRGGSYKIYDKWNKNNHSPDGVVSTKFGRLGGNPLALEDIVGGELTLESGDVVILASDGLNGKRKIDLIEELKRGGKGMNDIRQIIERKSDQSNGEHDDDKSVIIYQQG